MEHFARKWYTGLELWLNICMNAVSSYSIWYNFEAFLTIEYFSWVVCAKLDWLELKSNNCQSLLPTKGWILYNLFSLFKKQINL